MNMQIKTIIILWTLVMILGSCSSDDGTKSKFKGGDGSKANPYQIENVTQLELVRENVKKHFKLLKDIDLKDVKNFKPIGDANKPFTGVFDGNGKKIKNLKINEPNGKYVGFFRGLFVTGVVKNIGLEDVDVTGNKFVGGLLGSNTGGIVENSYVTGKVKAEKDSVGGLVGWNKGKIERSYSTASVNSKGNIAGGLVGINMGKGVLIKNSYATGAVEGKQGVGGLAGSNVDEGEVNNSYATGKVTGGLIKGGFLGNIGEPGMKDGKLTGKNYWKTGSSTQGVGQGGGANIEEKTEAELKALTAAATSWDTAIWEFKAGEYPKLK